MKNKVKQLSLFDVIEIPLTQGCVALVDPIDADLADHKWHAHKPFNTYYALRGNGRRDPVVRMHRVVLSRILGRTLRSNEYPDHIDGNGLNNRRVNLRLALRKENNRNVGRRKDNISGYKGVTCVKRLLDIKWRAEIGVNCKRIYLGQFDTPEEAHRAYCEAAKKYFGEFARTE